ncbi:hypothetical protein N8295_02040 [Pseudomonadales bacterium]|nr:hypothetical protein [Pseudomonadales bacterium]
MTIAGLITDRFGMQWVVPLAGLRDSQDVFRDDSRRQHGAEPSDCPRRQLYWAATEPDNAF